MLVDVVVERHAAHLLDDEPRKCRAVVRIGGHLARRPYACRHVILHRLENRPLPGRIVLDQVTEESFFEAGGVRHDVRIVTGLP